MEGVRPAGEAGAVARGAVQPRASRRPAGRQGKSARRVKILKLPRHCGEVDSWPRFIQSDSRCCVIHCAWTQPWRISMRVGKLVKRWKSEEKKSPTWIFLH